MMTDSAVADNAVDMKVTTKAAAAAEQKETSSSGSIAKEPQQYEEDTAMPNASPVEAFQDEPETDAEHVLEGKDGGKRNAVETKGDKADTQVPPQKEKQPAVSIASKESNEKQPVSDKKPRAEQKSLPKHDNPTRLHPKVKPLPASPSRRKLPLPPKTPRAKTRLPAGPSSRNNNNNNNNSTPKSPRHYPDKLDNKNSNDTTFGKGHLDRLASLPSLFSPPPEQPPHNNSMSDQDLEICRRLDQEYERALEEREVGYNARYNSVRQSAGFSIAFMVGYMTLGTIFFTHVSKWELHQALFFSVYTITTVGYGSHELPNTPGFQMYCIFYIFVGIATLTIMVAQVYQCIALEASRAQHSRDKAELAQRDNDAIMRMESSDHGSSPHTTGNLFLEKESSSERLLDRMFRSHDACRRFLRDTEFGRGLSVLFPFAGLILIGAIVVGPIEGWGVVQSIYFAVVSLTTVGYGDYYPSQAASIWFTIFWLPFSVGFMSLFLGNVAAFYIRLSDKNIQRLERQMRRRMQRAKDEAEKERAEILRRAYRGQHDLDLEQEEGPDEEQQGNRSSKVAGLRGRLTQSGFESLPNGNDDSDEEVLFGSPEAVETIGQQRRERILENSIYAPKDASDPQLGGQTMTTMRDILKSVRRNVPNGNVGFTYPDDNDARGPENEFMSMRSMTLLSSTTAGRQPLIQKRPSFALRALVQERMAEIIAMDIAGFQSNIEIHGTTLSVTIDSLTETADKWLIPRRARKAFRSVAFEALYFVGEHGLITRGADALFDLTPFEFHGLFSPLLAAYGDAETMEAWLASTNVLADVDLKRDSPRVSRRHDDRRQRGATSKGGESTRAPKEKEEKMKPTHPKVEQGEPC